MLFPSNEAAQPKPFSDLFKQLLLQGTEPATACIEPVAFPTRSFEKQSKPSLVFCFFAPCAPAVAALFCAKEAKEAKEATSCSGG